MSIEIDELGTYDTESLPEGLSLPIALDESNEAIIGNDGVILARYAGETIEQSVLLQEKRKIQFLIKLANGELIVRKDKSGNDRVFKRVKQFVTKDGKIGMEFEEVKQLASA